MRRVLVTGGSGYLGALTVAALSKAGLGALVSLDVRAPRERAPGVVYETTSITSPRVGELIGEHAIDVVVHLASLVKPPKQGGDALAYEVDVLGTKNLLEAAVARGVRRVVVTSSGAAYGYHPDHPAWLDEATPLRGNDAFAYSRNKRLAEELLAEYRERHPGLAQLIFRPGTVLGPTVDSPVTALFEQPVVLGVMGSESPFVFIDDSDVVACLVKGALEDAEGAYNLAGDGALSPRELARLLRKPYLPIPPRVLGLALAALQRAGLSARGAEQVDFLRYRPVLSNARLKREFGYTPRYTSREAFERFRAARLG
ncbi:MAG: NAD-dependent epimerase/dehydratase family protein [Sorangiineae bacterium]|nr:NAD-dependent epimerase/dehydratase family protein [Polyangiaceae bacterium]MEB2322810.1 NAD-dependent epimerase/dehydratase family protein [Sorangiineae bacterium]